MMRRTTAVLLVMVLVHSAGSLLAHDNFRIIGTLSRLANSRIEVKNREGRTISVLLDKQTVVSRDKKKVDVAELRVGQSLVVDAYGDTEDDSLAVEIRIVPPIGGGSR